MILSNIGLSGLDRNIQLEFVIKNIKTSFECFQENIVILDEILIAINSNYSVLDIMISMVKNLCNIMSSKIPNNLLTYYMLVVDTDPYKVLTELIILAAETNDKSLSVVLTFPFGENIPINVLVGLAEVLLKISKENSVLKLKWIMLLNCPNTMQNTFRCCKDIICNADIIVHMCFPDNKEDGVAYEDTAVQLYNNYMSAVLPVLPITIPPEILLNIHESFHRHSRCVYSSAVTR